MQFSSKQTAFVLLLAGLTLNAACGETLGVPTQNGTPDSSAPTGELATAARLLQDGPTTGQLQAAVASPYPRPIGTSELEPVLAMTGGPIATAEFDSVMIYLVNPTTSWKLDSGSSNDGDSDIYSRASVIIYNEGPEVVRVSGIWLRSVPDCYPRKGRSFGVLMEAAIVADRSLSISTVPSTTLVRGISQRLFFGIRTVSGRRSFLMSLGTPSRFSLAAGSVSLPRRIGRPRYLALARR